MYVSKLSNENFLLEALDGARVLVLPDLVGMEREELGQLLNEQAPLRVMIIREQSPEQDRRVQRILRDFPYAQILVLGGNQAVERLRAAGERRIHSLPSFKYVSIDGLQFMGVPYCLEGASESWIVQHRNFRGWFQWPRPPRPEVTRFARIFTAYTLTTVYTLAPTIEVRANRESYENWLQALLGARTREIHLAGTDADIAAVSQDLHQLDSHLLLQRLKNRMKLFSPGFASKMRGYPLSNMGHYPTVKDRLPKRKSVDLKKSSYSYTQEQEKQYVERLVEVYLHRTIGRVLHYEWYSPIQLMADRRAVLQIEIELTSGEVRTWHFARWSPRSEISYGPNENPTYTYRYQADELLGFIWGAQCELEFKSRVASTENLLGMGQLSALNFKEYVDQSGLEWHPFGAQRAIWKDSLDNPQLSFKEREKVLYRY